MTSPLVKGYDPDFDSDLPPGFMDDLIAELKREDALWHPVTEVRITNWITARVHARQINSIFMRGLFKVETRYSPYQGPKVPPAEFRVVLPMEVRHP